MTASAQRIRRFHGLHERGCFVIPNPWDVGSARVLEQLGFKALATTSAGFAWSAGFADNAVSVSVGGALARTAWTGFLAAAREIAEQGTFGSFARTATGAELNGLFNAIRS